MRLSNDLREFIELLNSRGAEYVILGAHSLAFHARPRFTGDFEIFVKPTAENAARILQALHDFGFGQVFEPHDFTAPGIVVQLGRAPNRVDLLTSISGVSIEEAFAGAVAAELDGVPVVILGREQLIRNKRAVGRAQDLADLEQLES
ncbi:MAG: nucleotidyltransferase [Verrucomicrobia bacterium]|nr:nucleotidyltransferase [Verrucomicrobiota bacterium]